MDQTDQQVANEFLETPTPPPATDPNPSQSSDPEPDEGNDANQEPEATKFEDLPEWAQREITKARREAAKYRVAAKGKAQEANPETIRTEIRREMAAEVAGALIQAALTGIVDDPADILEDINLSRYVTEEGEIDKDAITALKSKYTRLVKRQSTGHGRTGTPSSQSAADQFADVLRSLGA